MVRFFDNLVVNLRHGPLVEQTDYYAFGMAIPGLSTSAYKYDYHPNRYKYNGIELDTALGLDYYEARFRDYDPQIARFTQIDPKVESAEGWSVYSAMLDNPALHSDPLGDSTILPANLYTHKNTDGDQTGLIRNATSKEYSENPVKALIKDIIHGATELTGLNSFDDAGAILKDPYASATDKVLAVLNIGLSTPGEGEAEKPKTNFVVSEKGSVVVIPEGASGPSAPEKGTGMAYKNGSGGHGMDEKVTGVRIMDANGNQPSRVNYMNKSGQTVDPLTGKTISKSDKRGHIPFFSINIKCQIRSLSKIYLTNN